MATTSHELAFVPSLAPSSLDTSSTVSAAIAPTEEPNDYASPTSATSSAPSTTPATEASSTSTSATTPASPVADPWDRWSLPRQQQKPAVVKPIAGPETTSLPDSIEARLATVPEPARSEPLSLDGVMVPGGTDTGIDPEETQAVEKQTQTNPEEKILGLQRQHQHQAPPPPLPLRDPIGPSSSRRLNDALNNLVLSQSGTTPVTALPVLKSPCFYHQRFDESVNIDKILEEIKNDDSMSHGRLVQTATGVREVSKQLQRRPIKRAVRSVMIVTKARDNELVNHTRELATWLMSTPRYNSDLGVTVYVDLQLRNSKRFNAAGILEKNPRFKNMLKYWTPDLCMNYPDEFDLVLTLGGDGTVLFTSWLFQRVVPPTLSFSLGSLGFLTTFEYERYVDHLDRIMGNSGMKVNLRMRFTCTLWRAGPDGQTRQGEQYEVLNELVIDRGPSPYVSNMELYGDDELLTVVQADGCIFSTPTGSTAYSLSAGGSLVHPDIPAILLTPICPHTLSFRPMVLSDTMELRVAIPRNSRATAYCAFDGKGRIELRQGDYITISASQYPFPTVTRTDTEWFDSVSRTLRWNVRAAAQKPFDSGAGSEAGCDAESDGWDIDTDSGFYASEDGSVAASPRRLEM
ncbi:NAD+ kinase [Geosmithia morbida]|uniref:NAD+ kinase n=1 Tax=Geosmithia morbida TaxID=1094350 RepID=A0A9P5D442_9HYPO|nr:NAD+ kinase [Geosmithia morbida]KAF4122435.1 NAD+ kinase [Geosmithia morbida]